MTSGWARQIFNQVVVLRIQGSKVRPPCKISHRHYFCHICKASGHQILYWHQQTNFSTNPLVNKFLGPKSSFQCSWSFTFVNPSFQNPPQGNTPNTTQLPNTPLSHNFPPFRNPYMVQPHQLFNSWVPVIPPSIAPQIPNLNKPQQNPVYFRPAHQLPCPSHPPQLPLNCNLDLNIWHFPQNNPPKINQPTINAAVFNNFQSTLPPNTTNAAISHPMSQSIAPQNVNSNHAATSSIPINPFSTTTNNEPPFVKPVIHPTLGYTALIPLWWGSPPHPKQPAPTAEKGSLIRALTDALTKKRNDYPNYNGDPLQWHEFMVILKAQLTLSPYLMM